jgi:hypothetical protein
VLAGALLVPNSWLSIVLCEDPGLATPSLANLIKIAKRANASLEAVAIQLRSSLAWDVSVLHWERTRKGWAYRGEAGLPGGTLRYVRPVHSTANSLSEAWTRGPAPQPMRVQLHIGRVNSDFMVEVMARRKDAVLFVDHSTVDLDAAA